MSNPAVSWAKSAGGTGVTLQIVFVEELALLALLAQ